MKYEIKQEFLDFFEIKNKDDLEILCKNFDIIYNRLSDWRCVGATNYESFLNTVELKYGSFIKILMIYLDLDKNLQLDEGVYPYLYNAVMLTTQECQNTENYNIELFKKNTEQLITYFEINNLARNNLIKHFQKVNIQIDTRKTICFDDDEWNDIIQKCEDNGIWFARQMKRTSIVFDNPNLNNIKNIEELEELSDELKSLFISTYDNQFQADFFNLMNQTLERNNKVQIILHVGSEPDRYDDYSLNVEAIKNKNTNTIKFIRDFIDHPETVLNMYKLQMEDYIKASTNNRIIAIITHNPNVINYIRYLVYKGQVEIYDEKFGYVDVNHKKHYIEIDKNGRFCGPFPSGFFDATLEMLLEIG